MHTPRPTSVTPNVPGDPRAVRLSERTVGQLKKLNLCQMVSLCLFHLLYCCADRARWLPNAMVFIFELPVITLAQHIQRSTLSTTCELLSRKVGIRQPRRKLAQLSASAIACSVVRCAPFAHSNSNTTSPSRARAPANTAVTCFCATCSSGAPM